MDWREAAAGGLPAPRKDEPASLRQDILDEVADHLECALKRELTKNITPDEAIENVKRRFGNPQDLARRLWLDAMKDTIMSKRLTFAAMGLMCVMCLLLGWMAWTSQRASQEAAWMSREAAASIRRTNNELLQKLTTRLAARPAAGGSGAAAARFPVRLHLACDDANKSPARGYSGTLALTHGSLNALPRTSDGNGDLDFGMLPAGQYTVTISTPWRETTQFPFEVSPGFPSESPVECPAQDWQPAEVAMKFVDLPPLTDRDALIYCRLSSEQSRRVGERRGYWLHPDNGGGTQQGFDEFDVVLDPAGRIVYFDNASRVQRFQPRDKRYALSLQHGVRNDFFQLLAPSDEFSWLANGLKHSAKLNFYARKYALQSVVVVLASDLRRQAGERIERSKLPHTLLTWEPGWTPYAGGGDFSDLNEPVSLTPVAGRRNVFEVHLAPDFVERADKMLLSSASRVPEPANAAEAKTETTAGVELLKTLGIDNVVPEQVPGGLTGLRLKSIRDALPAKQAGLMDGDLLLGIEGWNINDDRELGWASRVFRRELHPVSGLRFWWSDGSARGLGPRDWLVTLVRRGSETLLFEIRPAGSPSPHSSSTDKDLPAARSSAQSGPPSMGLRGRRRAPDP